MSGPHFRSNYWSHSRLANWVIKKCGGHPQISSGTSEEWVAWTKEAKKYKFVYWFTEKFLNKLQNAVNWPRDQVYDVYLYVYNRYICKMHYLQTKLVPGRYYDVDTRLMNGMFETLVDFIEIEKAWTHIVWDKEMYKKYNGPTKWRLLRWSQWRNAEAGLAHLKWEMSLVYGKNDGVDEDNERYGKPTHQAIHAAAQYDIYHWWKHVRPNRPDPYDTSGIAQLQVTRRLDKMAEDDEDFDFMSMSLYDNEDERKATHAAYLRLGEIEDQYKAEDTQMMCKLIEIRQSLWT